MIKPTCIPSCHASDPDHVERALLPKDSYHAYVELHIEQGGTLERDGVAAGVVDGIVSIDDYNVVVTGFANHAGTTPMAQRQDALVAHLPCATS